MTPNYDAIKKLIQDTLANKPIGHEITPEEHQNLELAVLEYAKNLELIQVSTLIGFADANTVPVQPDGANAAYLNTMSNSTTVTFNNFRDVNGSPISVTTDNEHAALNILFWNAGNKSTRNGWSVYTTKIHITAIEDLSAIYDRIDEAQADANVLYKAEIRQPTVVNLSDETPEYTAPGVGGYLVVDETGNTSGIFIVDKTGNTGNSEKTLVQLPADNSKPTAIKLIGESGNIVHWKDYAPGTLIKVWWLQGDSFEIDGEGSLPIISDQRLKSDILDYDVAEEKATVKFLDSLDVQIDGETAVQLGQWGVRFNNFLELMKHGVATIWNGMGKMILHATNTGTHLFFDGKKILSADQRATALQQHRKVYCFGAEYVPFDELQEIYNQQGTIPSNIRRTFGSSETIYNGYLLAVTENGGQPIKLQPYTLSYPYTGYEYYRVGTVKDHYFYEDNTVVAGGVDNEDLAQFTTLNLGEGWLLQAGIGTFGGEGQTKQPALPYGYASEQWYMKLFDPLRRVIMSKNSAVAGGATQFWHNEAERMRFTANGVQLFGKVSGVNRPLTLFYKNNFTLDIQDYNFVHLFSISGITHNIIKGGELITSPSAADEIGYVSGNNYYLVYFYGWGVYKVDVQIILSEAVSEDLTVGFNYGTAQCIGPSIARIKAGELNLNVTLYFNASSNANNLSFVLYHGKPETTVSVNFQGILMTIEGMS